MTKSTLIEAIYASKQYVTYFKVIADINNNLPEHLKSVSYLQAVKLWKKCHHVQRYFLDGDFVFMAF
jgi:hypothetical protein